MAVSQSLLDLVVAEDTACLGIDHEYLSRLERPFLDHGTCRDGEASGFRGDSQKAFISDEITGRAKAVAVQHASGVAAVGEEYGGGAVPRFHKDGVVLVEGLQVAPDGVLLVERLRNHHRHHVRKLHPRVVEELHRIVERCAVAHTRLDDGGDVADISQRLGR